MAEKIEIDPGVGGTAFRATERATLKFARHLKIRDMKRQMKA